MKIPRSDMNQVDLPNPTLNDIKELQIENFQLYEELKDMESHMFCMEDIENGAYQEKEKCKQCKEKMRKEIEEEKNNNETL